MKLKINAVSKLTGISVRTLHYYDEIDLLKPSEITESKYRLYDREAMETLQHILFFRELDFSLNEIKQIVSNPHYNKVEALSKHKELLLQKRNRIDGLINLVEITLKGGNDMSFQQFGKREMEETKSKYATEVKERWGDTEAFGEYEEKTANYDSARWDFLSGEGDFLLQEFGKKRHVQPNSEEAQELVKKWKGYITSNFYTCTNEILSCLGQMYLADQRFSKNIDEKGEGTAAFMAAAIACYCGK